MDEASFDPGHVKSVYGNYPSCLLTGMIINVELHHILKRGGKYKRKLMSSILNCAPLESNIHQQGYIHWPKFQEFLLESARKRIERAIAIGSYEYTENDLHFLKQYES